MHYGSNLLGYLRPKIWEIVPNDIKDPEAVKAFQFAIKKWLPKNYSCRICKWYILYLH